MAEKHVHHFFSSKQQINKTKQNNKKHFMVICYLQKGMGGPVKNKNQLDRKVLPTVKR